MDFDGCEYEVQSNTFTDLDMNAVDYIQEHDPIIVPMVTNNTKLYTGMICENKEMLQHMVKCFAIKSHAPYEVVESTPIKWVIRCKKSNEGCKWRLRAIMKKSHGLFEITKLSDQSATPIEGHVILSSVFWAFGLYIEAFSRCRPLIQIDSTNLYGKYRGKSLIATSIDSNGHLLPLAFAIVEEESANSWGWFLRHLKQIVTHDEKILGLRAKLVAIESNILHCSARCDAVEIPGVEAMRRIVPLVKEGRQSYSVVLHGVLAMTFHYMFKESVDVKVSKAQVEKVWKETKRRVVLLTRHLTRHLVGGE
ncbi:uncharacterized protein E5676_scaffold232G001350 [Cucumis melo var. makuwa]|uniref:MULE transposase domain-containing protein n=2 Tax=Cucumis melo TaxID=3656 RepID=A0A5D3BJL0_CUCMM|nr:uncharacterized protein E5676_scaffold232G001350 [Cucumis melo var. makuwa]